MTNRGRIVRIVVGVGLALSMAACGLPTKYDEVVYTKDGSHCVIIHDIWNSHERLRHEDTAEGNVTHNWNGVYCPKEVVK